ncbi:Glyoxalase/Bleomycin resistance protein/Dihydroxybiphenyl dioxygenase [Paraphoma chrysanthemicola]|uniref:Glyoxalase/Bleomycin resistance protein/Dihydroxybiphenyl dioxygenase n=1 Tax=Paraphoma chrysanthemicola TaxID=798071 RepID=A0A8K0W434_9PLEO|nr:Glyoxalase/Bleomycin resistance protein/Dihydroxybiphenyl dioxygenase [Paraphoma chrysanthemicola]
MTAQKQINVVRLSHVTYEHPDLQLAASFLDDFGLFVVQRDDSKIYYAGYGQDPYCYVAIQSKEKKRKFLGGTFVVASRADLLAAASHPNATPIVNESGPGKGEKVSITDPNGQLVNFIFGQEVKTPAPTLEITRETNTETPQPNFAYQKARQGEFRRFKAGPSPVHKLGHYGYNVPAERFEETFDFYTKLINLKPTDSVYDPETNVDKTVFMHIDLGDTFSDHHSFFLNCAPKPTAHVHHASFEVNDFDTQSLGHNWLQKKGWVNCWGIGRHVLGSQIFDYWFDASGNILEHYCDGDLVNNKTPWARAAEAPDSLYIWGPNIPLGFVTGQVSDAGKEFVPPAPA